MPAHVDWIVWLLSLDLDAICGSELSKRLIAQCCNYLRRW